MVDPGLSGQVAVVTGANNPEGIGVSAARALAKQGASVFLHFHRSWPAPGFDVGTEPCWGHYQAAQAYSSQGVVDAILAAGGRAACTECDFSNRDSVERLFDEVERTLGFADILVNNAAVYEPDSFIHSEASVPRLTSTSFDRHFRVNTRAAALLMAEFAERRIRRSADGGRIINISTDAWFHAGAVSYGASKQALESFSRAAAWELAPFGITVNVLALGPVQTGWITPELERAMVPQIPLGRIGTPDEIAEVVVFFSSEQARWVTGQVLYVNGGKAMPK